MKNSTGIQTVRFLFRLLAGLLGLLELPVGALLVFATLHMLLYGGTRAPTGWILVILTMGVCAVASGLVFVLAAISGRDPFDRFAKSTDD